MSDETPPVAGDPELIEEFSFDYEPIPGLRYVTTNVMLAETMAAAKPSAKILTRWAPKWEALGERLEPAPREATTAKERREIVIHTLRSVAQDFDDEYERLTAEHGAYGQMKVRAAYRLASVLVGKRADDITKEGTR